MSNRKGIGICWSCIKRINCTMFKMNPNKITVDCGRFQCEPEIKKQFIEIGKKIYDGFQEGGGPK